jgi:hypothetical protein
MNNIDQYKRRFFNLLESEMGNVKPLITEDEDQWIDDSREMEGETNFDEMDKEQGVEEIKSVLSDDELQFLNQVMSQEGEEGLESKIENAIESKSEMNEEDSDFESEYGMSEDEFKMRNIVDKIIEKTSVLSMLGIVPAAMLSGGGAAVAAGVTALVAYLLKDAAWYNKKDTSGQMPGSGIRQGGMNYKAANKARSER